MGEISGNDLTAVDLDGKTILRQILRKWCAGVYIAFTGIRKWIVGGKL
jgi:hypothetical protein